MADVERDGADLRDGDGSGGGGSASDGPQLRGKVVPLNSRRLTSFHLKQIAEALELPATGSTDQLRQVIEGELESEKHVDAANVQVLIEDRETVEVKLCLMDDSGVILETRPHVHTKDVSNLEWQKLQEALAEANELNSQLSE